MSQPGNIPSILSCSQQPKKKKRISFSTNMLFQEFYSDGTTKTYEEKVDDDTCSMAMTLEDSETFMNETIYEFTMDLSDDSIIEKSIYASPPTTPPECSLVVSSPTTPMVKSPVVTLTTTPVNSSVVSPPNTPAVYSQVASPPTSLPENVPISSPPPVTSPVASPPKTPPVKSPVASPPTTPQVNSPVVTPPTPPPTTSPVSSPPTPPVTSPVVAPPTPRQVNSPVASVPTISPENSPVVTLPTPLPTTSPVASPPTTPPVTSPVVTPPTPRQVNSPVATPTTISPGNLPVSPPSKSSTTFSISFSSEASLELSRRDASTVCCSLFSPSREAVDSIHDSIMVYAQEKPFLDSSGDEDFSPNKSINASYNTTFFASMFNEISVGSDVQKEDDVFDFIENSIFAKLPANVIDISSIDPALTKYIVDINDDCASLKFMQENFIVNIKYSVVDTEKTEVNLDGVSLECFIDEKIKQKVYTPISEYSPHLLTKPRDDKFISLIKKVVATKFQQFARENESTTNSLSSIIKKLRKMFHKVEAVFVDLCNVSRFYEWKIINSNIRDFEIAFEIFGLRYSLWLVLSFDLLSYPSNTIKVKFGVHKADLKLYPYHIFHKVMKSVDPGKNGYIGQIVKTAIKFILNWRNNHAKKSIRLSIHPSRRTMGEHTIANLNK